MTDSWSQPATYPPPYVKYDILGGVTPDSCMNPPAFIAGDGGITGVGVIINAIFAPGLAVILAVAIIYKQFRTNEEPILRMKLLSTTFDYVLFSGFVNMIVALIKMNHKTFYHLYAAWQMGNLFTVAHSITTLTMAQKLREDPVLRTTRFIFMLLNGVLNLILGAYLIAAKHVGLPPTAPIGCLNLRLGHPPTVHFTRAPGDDVSGIMLILGIFLILNLVALLFGTVYLYKPIQPPQNKSVLAGSAAVLMAVYGIASWQLIVETQPFGKPDVPLKDYGEMEWSYGQIVCMLYLFMQVFTVLGATRGKSKT